MKLYFAHESAYIDQGCEIGEGTKIWHFSHIMANCKIGKHCNIGQNVVVSPDVILGNNVKVQNNVSIYTGVTCEDDVFLGPSMVFTNVINPRSAISRKSEYLPTKVGKGATVGANATIVCGNTIGSYAFIGAGAVVTKDVPADGAYVSPALVIMPAQTDTVREETFAPILYVVEAETLAEAISTIPSAWRWVTSSITPAMCRSALEGMQPTFRQTPPRLL